MISAIRIVAAPSGNCSTVLSAIAATLPEYGVKIGGRPLDGP